MIVYCTNIWFRPTTNRDEIVARINDWVRMKIHQITGQSFDLSQILPGTQHSIADNKVEIEETQQSQGKHSWMKSVRYIHPDIRTVGREWITEIGIRQDDQDKDLQVSILLKAEDACTGIESPVPTRPKIIRTLLQDLSPDLSPNTFGYSIFELDDSDDRMNEFWWDIQRSDRKYPIVLVSTTKEGEYLVDPEKLRSQLIGVANIAKLLPGANEFRVSEEIGSKYAAWRGAINILFPEHQRYVFTHLLHQDNLVELESTGNDASIRQILSLVTSRTNLPNFRLHTSFEKVLEENRSRRLIQLREQAEETGETKEFISLLEEENAKLSSKVDDLEKRLKEEQEYGEISLCVKEDEISQLKFEVDSLKTRLKQVYTSKQTESADTNEEFIEIRQSIIAVFSENPPTLTQSLQVLQYLFRENVFVLDTAWKSAKESESFRYRTDAFRLLKTLLTDYRDALLRGGGNAEARNLFGRNDFSARESETVEDNTNARKRRTFQYKGEDVEMMSHLKIGIKDSITETLRIHFMWDSGERKIVIGHCGKHLGFS